MESMLCVLLLSLLATGALAAPHGTFVTAGGAGAVVGGTYQATFTTHPVAELPVATFLSSGTPALLPKVRVAATKIDVIKPEVELERDLNVHVQAPAEVRVHRPKYHVTQPEVHVSKPEFRVKQPDVHVVQPEVRVSRPKLHVTQPKIHVTQPEIHVRKQDVHVVQPQLHVEQPDVHVHQQHVQVNKPEVHVARPEYHVVKDAQYTYSEADDHFVHQSPTVHVDDSQPDVHVTRTQYKVDEAPTYHEVAPVVAGTSGVASSGAITTYHHGAVAGATFVGTGTTLIGSGASHHHGKSIGL